MNTFQTKQNNFNYNKKQTSFSKNCEIYKEHLRDPKYKNRNVQKLGKTQRLSILQ